MGWSEDSNFLVSNGTSEVVVVPAPEFGNKHELVSLTICNKDTGTIQPTISVKKDTTKYKFGLDGTIAIGATWALARDVRQLLKAIDESIVLELAGAVAVTEADIIATWGVITEG